MNKFVTNVIRLMKRNLADMVSFDWPIDGFKVRILMVATRNTKRSHAYDLSMSGWYAYSRRWMAILTGLMHEIATYGLSGEIHATGGKDNRITFTVSTPLSALTLRKILEEKAVNIDCEQIRKG